MQRPAEIYTIQAPFHMDGSMLPVQTHVLLPYPPGMEVQEWEANLRHVWLMGYRQIPSGQAF